MCVLVKIIFNMALTFKDPQHSTQHETSMIYDSISLLYPWESLPPLAWELLIAFVRIELEKTSSYSHAKDTILKSTFSQGQSLGK